MNKKIDLSLYNNAWYKPGNIFKRAIWYCINIFFFRSSFIWPNHLKVALLKLFGAKVGRNLILKPNINIKFPWFLEMGNNVWLGEKCWIDNLGKVRIKDNVCISQGAMLLTGNHNYKKETFDLIIGEVTLEDGVWVGAMAIVCPGVTMHTHSILLAGSVLTHNAEAHGIYQGNPAELKKKRIIDE